MCSYSDSVNWKMENVSISLDFDLTFYGVECYLLCISWLFILNTKVFYLHSELNDTIVEAQLRTRQVPPLLPNEMAVDCFSKSNNRLIILVSC